MGRLSILLPLPIIAAWVFYSGMNYEPDELTLTSLRPGIAETLPRVDRFIGPENTRAYGNENLYEYVNGHAEFFISSGFVSLTVGEYKIKDKGEAVAEVYDMGNSENVLAVITSERGSAKQLKKLGDRAFISKGGLMFGKDNRFVRVGNFGLTDEEAILLADSIAKSFASSDKPSSTASFLPKIKMSPNSEGFVKSDYLGLSFLADVKTAKYNFGEIESEGFYFPSSPKKMLAFFRSEGSEIETGTIDGLDTHTINDKYEGKINVITNGNDTVGIRGDIQKEGIDAYLGEAAERLKK